MKTSKQLRKLAKEAGTLASEIGHWMQNLDLMTAELHSAAYDLLSDVVDIEEACRDMADVLEKLGH